jgi:L-ribulose-5-phosphate 3-epimerase
MKTSRRNFIAKSALTAAGVAAGLNSFARSSANEISGTGTSLLNGVKEPDAFKISIFSKHLQWLDYKEMAKVVAELGFDGVDLTVRPQGHVLPERVEEDLPKAVEAIEKAGKKVYMLTTAINNAEDPVSEKILRTAAALGIKHYRTGYGYYDKKRSVEESTRIVFENLGKLAKLNEKYSISGEYQNHSGDYGSGIYFGGPVWDLIAALKKINSPFLGSQYDIYHATIEGANAWPVALELMSPFIRSIDIKDFFWSKKDGKWSSETVPLGEGAVDFKRYLAMIKQLNISCPVSMHYEYPLGGAENGADKLTMKREDVLSKMKKDLLTLQGYLREAKII